MSLDKKVGCYIGIGAFLVYFLYVFVKLDYKDQITAMSLMSTIGLGIFVHYTTRSRELEAHIRTKDREYETHERTKDREFKSRMFAEQKSAFKNFIYFVVNLPLTHSASNGKKTEYDMNRIWKEFGPSLVSWGSHEAIQSLIDFRKSVLAKEAPLLSLVYANNLLVSLRKELGHDDSKSDPMLVMKMIIKDDEHDNLDATFALFKEKSERLMMEVENASI